MNYRVGLDALVGLIPIVGDLIGMLFSTYIVVQAARLGLHYSTVTRMAFNVLVETVIGSIPLVGTSSMASGRRTNGTSRSLNPR